MNVQLYLRPKTYGLAVLSVAMALLLMGLLNLIANMAMTPFLLFFGSVVVAAWWGGAASGLLAMGLSALVSNYFFMAPYYSLSLDTLSIIRVVVFVGQSVVLSLICGSLRATRYRLENSSLQLQESEFSLRSTNQWVTAILESITDGFYAVDLQWRFVYINPQAQHLFHRPLEVLLGQSIWEVLPNLEGSAMGESFQRAMATRQSLIVEIPGVVHPDRLFEMHINPLANGLAVYFRDVTDRRNSQRQLYQQMQMLDLANDSIIIQDLDSAIITYWNQGAARRYGWSAAEAIGQSTTDLLKTVLPEPMEAIREAILQDGYWTGELTQTTREGCSIITNSRWTLQSTPENEPDAVLEISSDVTEQKQVEAALRKSELHFRTLANSMPQMFWTALPDGQLEYCNQRWYDYTGLSPAQSFAEGWLVVLHPDDRDRCQTAWDEALQKGLPLTLETRPQRAADGQYRWHLVRAFPLRDEQGEVLRWFGSSTDIHDQKMALVERDRALDQERVARSEAEAANRIKDEFLAMLSHELRTPLNPILGWVSLLRSRPLDEPTRTRALETIERNAKVQAELIEDLLDVSRILRGKLPLNIQSVALSSVVQAALETVQLSAQAKAITVITEFDPDLGTVAGDHNRLQQIVWNLLSNAVKFTPKGGTLTIRLRQDGHSAVVEVADSGQGISADFLPYVFERFRQADSSSTRAYGGLGLGLAIVRYLTEQHGGEVAVTSPGLGQGSTFTVRLPLQATRPDPDPKLASPGIVNLTGRRVLVVDDDLDSLHLLTALLEDYGMEVLIAESAEVGLHLIEQHHPDVLISDIGMPDKDGIMLIQALRQWPAAKGGLTPAIALTAYVDAQTRDRAIAAGFQRHLSKPLDLDQLSQALVELICG
ncbi:MULTISPECIES: PAS domain-containing protein [Cyanophyceae]|uniref:hybrid sensor histidine kinase/response regulator n=1 Tax=Cyanophyceae TaxID=3028117 RepID=UPI00168A04A5|nr:MULTISPECIES: PAS domain-containing protein [Cyanophyceae]MBD1915698.1 PAS domain-containing protein [Phormidium sp. FACHB-77]MBD2029053.1 PAS domain-containing protein [Phormidium sp. FACHB-322]MBD2052190.1 PAS domain-containing protein [Leptolyngbya sp. FACHB-60]